MHRRGADLSVGQFGGGPVSGIRLVPNESTPDAVRQYLLPSERKVITVRRHPAALIPSASRAVGGLLAAAAVTRVGDSRNVVEIVVWLAAGGLLVQFGAAIYGWHVGYMAVTNRRFIFVTAGILGNRAEQFPVEQAKKMDYKRSVGGRLLGYGSFVFEFDGSPERIVEYMPYPKALYIEMQELVLSPNTERDDE
jgi:PH (Pleckstrin Homology) domain-containing protein